MPVNVLVGSQWGDEGKGKMIDYLSNDMDLIVRFQGGDNAGHTVVNDKGVFKLHLIPSGIFKEDCISLIGTGTVANPDVIIKELEEIQKAGVNTDNLKISGKAQILMPYHQVLDALMEKKGGIGTTKRGIGVAYAFKDLRKNFRFEDLLDEESLKDKIKNFLPSINGFLKVYGADEITEEDILSKTSEWSEKLKDRIVNQHELIHDYIDNDKNILFEGQLAAMKDIDLGIYPYVTSSNPVAAYAAVSSGFPAKQIDNVIGVAKAFSSAVGGGPFPTESTDTEIDQLRGSGEKPDDEYGARTGRSRRLGWFDAPIVKYTNEINGYDELALCKLDKLDELDKIKICTGYRLDGKDIDYMPTTTELEKVEPIYIELPGWLESTTDVRKIEDLPENAKNYLKKIEELTGASIKYVGVGPGRDEIAI